MEGVAIVLLAIVSAVVYGVVHDQVTARVCIEYFTIGHPPIFPTESPTLLGLGWGVVATWWAGLLLGVPLALAARPGDTRSGACGRSCGQLPRSYWSWPRALSSPALWVTHSASAEWFTFLIGWPRACLDTGTRIPGRFVGPFGKLLHRFRGWSRGRRASLRSRPVDSGLPD